MKQDRSEEGRDRYDALAEAIAASGRARPGKMFGMPSIFGPDRKSIMGYFDGHMVFKLAGKAHADALALPGAALFDPSGTGRAMKAWVQVPAASADRWEELAETALAEAGEG